MATQTFSPAEQRLAHAILDAFEDGQFLIQERDFDCTPGQFLRVARKLNAGGGDLPVLGRISGDTWQMTEPAPAWY